jgi:thymidylate synthase
MGTYTHRANSFHCYEKDYGLLQGYIERLESGQAATFDYEGEWEELMDECKPKIAQTVETLKAGKESK